MATKKIDRLFLVEQAKWVADPFRRGKYLRLPGAAPVRAFLHHDKAEAKCRALDEKAWAGINPFHYGDKLADWTSLDAGRLRDWMLDLGLEPPKGKFDVNRWRAWYDEVLPGLDAAQLAKVREALDRLRFYRVSEIT